MQLNEQELHREIYYHEEFFLNIISFWKKKEFLMYQIYGIYSWWKFNKKKKQYYKLINNIKFKKRFNVLPPITLDFSYGFTFSLFLA